MVGKRTKVLVPVGTDSNGQLRLTPEALQKAILMVTKGGQVENLPQGGLILNNSNSLILNNSNSIIQTRISEDANVMITNEDLCQPSAWPKVENLSQTGLNLNNSKASKIQTRISEDSDVMITNDDLMVTNDDVMITNDDAMITNVDVMITNEDDVMITNVVKKPEDFCPSSLVPAWPKDTFETEFDDREDSPTKEMQALIPSSYTKRS